MYRWGEGWWGWGEVVVNVARGGERDEEVVSGGMKVGVG